jgi:uncharacterized protein Yka (UPF0111/DUF47 family)
MMHLRLLPRDMQFIRSFEQAAATTHQAAAALVDLLDCDEEVSATLACLKELAQQTERTTHATMSALAQTFVTPLDHADMVALTCALDEVTRFIWAAADRLSVFQIQSITPTAQATARVLEQQTSALSEAVALLRHRNCIPQILPLTVEINRLQHDMDKLLQDGIAQLFSQPDDLHDIVRSIKWREIYELLDMAGDKTQRAANVLEGIVLKAHLMARTA